MRRGSVTFLHSVNLIVSKTIIIIAHPHCRFCNKRERRRGNNNVAKDTNCPAGKLPLYSLEDFIRFHPVFMLRMPSGLLRLVFGELLPDVSKERTFFMCSRMSPSIGS
jgi:hypothetical protein